MKLKFYLLIPTLIMLTVGHVQAQVTIGSATPPAEFAALQIDGNEQGLRLSRLTTAERNGLNAGSNAAKAKGLVIYNTTTATIEFYDGVNWRSLSKPLEFENGINRNALGNVELGGDLIEATTINQGVNPMNFTTSGGTFSVNTNVFSVNNTNIIANVDNFLVKNSAGTNDVFKITNTAGNNTIDANVSTSGLDVNSGALNIAGTKTTIGGNFVYKDGTQGVGKVLMSDAGGKASWGTLTPSTEYKNFTITMTEGTVTNSGGTTGSVGTSLNTSAFGSITGDVTLTSGKWLVTGMLYTYTREATNSTSVYLIKMRLYDSTNGKSLYTTADLPESKGRIASGPIYSGGAFSAIPMTCFVEVPSGESWNVRVEAMTPRTATYLIRDYGWLNPNRGSEFKAMRVND